MKSDGHTSAPCVLHLKAGTTERIPARNRGRDVLLGSQQRPVETPPKVPTAARALLWALALAAALTILYAANNAFAG
ncbi:hypothetical protein ADK87_02160 [Streptomyces sp. NRRL F-4711]|nr:hypothetical protein ADK87_02160 [Streptomyces sp. NRRL F-4711]